MIRRPPRSTRTDTLFPYTTLVRSGREQVAVRAQVRRDRVEVGVAIGDQRELPVAGQRGAQCLRLHGKRGWIGARQRQQQQARTGHFARSEERRVGTEWVSTCRSWGSA